ncbi:MAG TPA: toll/interleukin-1 receptor domain-containing protein [Steroidobacteraceae bacterium]|jgi:hypothetical protein
MEHKYDCFISHAGEDKEGFVEPLAMELHRLGMRVWFDRFTIKVGDSLSRSIDDGLAQSRYGVLVISHAFLRKPWPEYELRGLVAREIGKEKVILPIWYGVSRDDIIGFSPPLADKMAILSVDDDVAPVARQLMEVIRPDLFEHIQRAEALRRKLRSLPVKEVPWSRIKVDTLIRHHRLTPQQMVRIRNIHYILRQVHDVGLGEMVLDFKRDLRINDEIFIWEGIAAAFASYSSATRASLDELHEVFGALLLMSMQSIQKVLEDDGGFRYLNRAKRESLLRIWSQVSDEVEFLPENS